MMKECSELDELPDSELVRLCILALSDAVLYSNELISRHYDLAVKRDEMRRICYAYKKLWNTLNTTDKPHIC